MSGEPEDCQRCHGSEVICESDPALCPYEDEPPLAVRVLNLHGVALAAATELARKFAGVVFASGRRTVREQARAMAANAAADVDFVRSTYVNSLAARRCQAWVDMHLTAKQDQIAEAFERILCDLPDSELAHLTRHVSGDAFDVVPSTAAVRAFLVELADRHGGKFLDHEGKLLRWHWEAK